MSNSNPAVPPRRYHILNLEPLGFCDEAREVLGRLGDISEGPLSRRELLERVSAYEILIIRLQHQIDQDVFEAGKNLKAIVSATTGLDHIELEAARACDVAVLSLKGEEEFLRTITATAEHTWALLLAVMRRIPEACDSVRAGQWDRDALKGHDLAGKRLGIVGLGRLGKQIASYGAAFLMQVAAYDPYLDTWPSTVVRKHSLPELLAVSDVVTVHVDLNPRTLKLIGRPELAALPRGAVLVNTSRGQVLDEAAVLDALVSGQLRGVGLDVLAEERVFDGHRDNGLVDYARHHHNILITPHIGGATHEAMSKTEVFMAHKLTQFLHNA